MLELDHQQHTFLFNSNKMQYIKKILEDSWSCDDSLQAGDHSVQVVGTPG